MSLLPIYGKIFERLIFTSLYQFLEEHKILSTHQTGFRFNDSCINQLLFIFHTLYKAFDAYPTLDIRSVFLDISKAFHKILQKGFIYKLISRSFRFVTKGYSEIFNKMISKSLTQCSDFRMVARKSNCVSRFYS